MANSAANSLEKAILRRCEPRILSAAEVRRRASDRDAEHESDFGFVSSHQRSDSEIQNPRESINKLQSSAADRHLELTALFFFYYKYVFAHRVSSIDDFQRETLLLKNRKRETLF